MNLSFSISRVKLSHLLVCSLCTFVIFSCKSPQKVIKYVNQNSNFENYFSYSLVNYKTEKKELTASGNRFIIEMENVINSIMLDRNYYESHDPDLILRYETVSGVKTTTNSPNYYGNPYYYNPYDPMNQNRTRNSVEGLLLIEIKDAKTKKLVWQGSVDLRYSNDEEANRDLIKNSVHRIFSTYPYNAGSNTPIETSPDNKKK